MTFYNLTNLTLANTTLEQLKTVDRELTGGWFSILLIIALFVIIFINLSFYNSSSAFLVAGFFTNIVAGLFWLAGLVPIHVFIVTLILPFAGIILIFWLKA